MNHKILQILKNGGLFVLLLGADFLYHTEGQQSQSDCQRSF